MNDKVKSEGVIVELCRAHSTLQFDAMADILEKNDIPYTYRRKGLSLGSFFEYSSKRSYIQVLVYEEDKEKALELIDLVLHTL